MNGTKGPSVYTIPAGESFVDSLASGIMKEADGDPLTLARMQILLPTRRACRSLREAFLRLSDGKPMLLPRMDPIGDIDEEELSLTLSGTEDELTLPPSIHPMARLFLMTRLIGSIEERSRGIEQDMALASALGRLMDQIYTENLNLADLPKVVDRDDFSEHWQVSIDFLTILSEHWPNILAERSVIDAADRRNRLLQKLSDLWEKTPPAHTIIAAGSTGSIPATRRLLKTIANLPNGSIVLPGLDQIMDAESWRVIDDTHPQATLRELLKAIQIDRHGVALWPACKTDGKAGMPLLVSEIMRPPETTHHWQTVTERISIPVLPVERYECAGPQEEALVIALALRETLEDRHKTAALVTPDRKLARRVAMACRRWNIEIDDSGGQPLSETRAGTYLRLCMEALCHEMKPVALLNFCKHGLCNPTKFDGWRGAIRTLDKSFLRGPAFDGGMQAYRQKIERFKGEKKNTTHLEKTLSFIEKSFAPLLKSAGEKRSFTEWSEAHISVSEVFCDPSILWSGEDGEAAAIAFSELRDQCADLPPLTGREYLALLERIMKTIMVRPAYGIHPRLMILGQLEARLVQADVMILSGLNEGTWPADTGMDPWMSRPMRKRFGLPPLERSIGLSAHDFAQGMGAGKIILTRSLRVDGTPTVPSRWLQRMDTVLQAGNMKLAEGRLLSYARAIDLAGDYKPVERPEPRPPVSARPRRVSATKIETWMNDPYSIYAYYILNLKPLKALEQPLDAAMRGTITHNMLQGFVELYKNDIPSEAKSRFIQIARDELDSIGVPADIRTFWEPRLGKIGAWIVETEIDWRLDMLPAKLEASGEINLIGPAGPFALTARADRIDLSRDGREGAIVDYKSGGTYSAKGMIAGKHPQLPLEALILEGGGFEDTKAVEVSKLAYWVVNGSGDGGSICSLEDPEKVKQAKELAKDGLQQLIETFDSEQTPYYSIPNPERTPRYNDYEHLARILEWASLDDQEDVT